MIKFDNVSFSYGEKQIIKNLSFTVNDGENLLITGPSGCGKTTVARLISGLIKPDSGSVLAPENISVVFQENRLIKKLNVYKNICLPLKKPQLALADRLIEDFGFDDLKHKSISELSGGMIRRVAILRAISFGGDALLLDEPFNGIDSENISLIAKIIKREYNENKKSVIIISHNKADAEIFKAKVLTLE